jgi:hypothetical protein
MMSGGGHDAEALLQAAIWLKWIRDDTEDERVALPTSTEEINAVIEVLERVANPGLIQVSGTQLTRQEIIESLDDYITETKDNAAALLGFVSRLPSSPEQAHILKELQRIQGQLGGVLMQLIRALNADVQRQPPEI